MGEFLIGIIMGLVIGFFGGIAFVLDASETLNEKYAAITECESTLPRNQTCKYIITAVPEVKE